MQTVYLNRGSTYNFLCHLRHSDSFQSIGQRVMLAAEYGFGIGFSNALVVFDVRRSRKAML